MSGQSVEIKRRASAAFAAIQSSINDKTSSVRLFAEHHASELLEDFWQEHLNQSKPSIDDVISLLILKSHWAIDEDDEIDEDGIEFFDFTLPGGVTDYVIAVQFDEVGAITSISMES